MEADWIGLELRHLTALVTVAEEGTFSRAAARLGYTQSAVSQQVAALERVVGTPVFDRPGGPRPVTLTEAGTALLGHARAVLARIRGAEADLRAVVAGERGRLRVGTVQSVGTRVLPEVLRRFHEARPGVEIALRESHDPAALLDLLVEGELDVTFCELPLTPGPFASRQVLEDPFILLAPADSPLAARPSVTGGDLVGLPLIGHRNAVCLGLTLAALGPAAEAPRFVFHSDDNTTIQGCVGAGLGYAVVPALTVDPDGPDTTVVPIVPEPQPRLLGLAWHSERLPSPALDAFTEVTLAVCEGLSLLPA